MSTPADQQRRQMEADLRDASTRLEAILGAAEVGTWTWDILNDRVVADRNMNRIFGISHAPEGLPSAGFFKAIHPDDLPHVTERLQRSMADNDVGFEDDYRVVQPEGGVRWVTARGSFHRNAHRRPVSMSGVLIDITGRKKAEAERDILLERERAARLEADALNARLNFSLSSLELGDWHWDASSDVMTLSARTAAIYGVPPGSGMTREAMRAVLHDDDRARARSAAAEAVATHADYSIEYRVRHPARGLRWVAARGRPVFGSDGSVTGMMGVVQDITEHRAQQQAVLELSRKLRAQAAHFETTLANIHDFVYSFDREGRFTYVNRALLDLWGLTLDQAVGKNFTELAYPRELAGRLMRELAQVVATRRPFTGETPYTNPEGRLGYYEYIFSPIFDEQGEVTAIAGTTRDITQRRAQEQSVLELSRKLHAQTAHFEATLSNLNDFVYSFDREGRVTYANRALLELWQQSSLEECVGKSFLDLGYPDHLAQRHLSEIAQVIATRRPFTGETPYLTPSGKWVFYQYIFSPILDERGEVAAIAGTTRDTTRRKETELALAAAREELQRHAQTLEATVTERTARLQETIGELEAFSYSVSHDMRAPLRAMQGYADALLEDCAPQLDDTARQHLARIRKNAERLELLVRDILTYSRVAKEDIRLTAIPLQSFLDNLLPQIPSLQPPLAHVRLRRPLPVILAHEAYLSQIFTNLLGNAVKFVAPGIVPVVDISASDEEEFIKIVLADNGLGIAPGHFSRIFNIFGRVHPDKQYEGTGIGLSIVKKAVQRMGGSVGVESALGEGSRFWFTVRKHEQPHPPAGRG
ncbi:MAG TPA: PAS domain S-box protein [Rariglobus sp.]